MHHKKTLFIFSIGGLLLTIGIGLMLALAQPVQAQCGSQASSCKNCHETQAQFSVNNDGTRWHESHAFGDFCYLCHAGNSQAADEITAHTGMVPPLDDIQASCQQCHTDDLNERAQVYAAALNIELGSGTGTSGGANPGDTSDSEEPSLPQQEDIPSVPVIEQSNVSIPVDNQLVVDDPNVVDYAQRYDEIVLGKHPVNVGNIVLVVLIGLIAVGGGGFVLLNELRRSGVFAATTPVDGQYPPDVVEMLPSIAKLKQETRRSLRKLLTNSKKTDTVLSFVNTLDPTEKDEEDRP